jgi:hypothetical protein
MLLERSQKHESHSERARALNQIGHLYLKELDDKRAGSLRLRAGPRAGGRRTTSTRQDLERAAGSDMKLWAEALQILSEVTTHPNMPDEAKIPLFTRLGHWYSDKIAPAGSRPALLPGRALGRPRERGRARGHDAGVPRAQQWNELGAGAGFAAPIARPRRARPATCAPRPPSSSRRSSATAARARSVRADLRRDPGHEKACEALARIYRAARTTGRPREDPRAAAEALRGERAVEAICRIAELYEDQLNNLPEATRRYEAALERRPDEPDGAARARPHLQQDRGATRSCSRTSTAAHRSPRRPARRSTSRAHGRHPRGRVPRSREGRRDLEGSSRSTPPTRRALASLRHYRALDRWEDVVSLYEKHLKHHHRGQDAASRPCCDGPRAGGAGRLAGARAARSTSACSRSTRTTRARSSRSRTCARDRRRRRGAHGRRVARREGEKPERRRSMAARREDARRSAATATARSSATRSRARRAADNTAATHALRAAYLARGDAASAVELITRDRRHRRQPRQGPPLRRDGAVCCARRSRTTSAPRGRQEGGRPRPHQPATAW